MTAAMVSNEMLSEKFVGSASNDVIVQKENKFAALLGGAGDDTIQASDAGSLLAGGEGDDRLVGGKGRDKAVVEASLERLQVRKEGNVWTVTDIDSTEGTDTLQGVERILTIDGGIALDVAADEEAGQVALLLGAVFDQEESLDASYVRVGLDLLEQGVGIDELIDLAFDVLGVASPADIVDLLWTNIIGEAPTAEQAQPFIDLLNGEMTVAELTRLAMLTDLNQAQINFVGLQETGIFFA
jgi:Ca2+-binding RTX toxin-like protein